MEDETRDFLVLIVNTVSWVLLWMMLNVFFGIYCGYGFFEESPTIKNAGYYLFFAFSLAFLIKTIIKKWKL